MKRNDRESKINAVLTTLLVVFVCLLSFSVGVLSGKGWSDREYALKTIEENTQFANQTLEGATEESPLSADMTEKEVELLAKKALEEARKNPTPAGGDSEQILAEMEKLEEMQKSEQGEDSKDSKEMMAAKDKKEDKAEGKDKKADKKVAKKDKKKSKRMAASVPQKSKKVTMPKPKTVEWTVQVASYLSENEAETHSQKLIEKGFPAFPVAADVKGRTWYRVSIGSFKTRKEALKYERDLKKQAVVKDSVVHKILRK